MKEFKLPEENKSNEILEILKNGFARDNKILDVNNNLLKTIKKSAKREQEREKKEKKILSSLDKTLDEFAKDDIVSSKKIVKRLTDGFADKLIDIEQKLIDAEHERMIYYKEKLNDVTGFFKDKFDEILGPTKEYITLAYNSFVAVRGGVEKFLNYSGLFSKKSPELKEEVKQTKLLNKIFDHFKKSKKRDIREEAKDKKTWLDRVSSFFGSGDGEIGLSDVGIWTIIFEKYIKGFFRVLSKSFFKIFKSIKFIGKKVGPIAVVASLFEGIKSAIKNIEKESTVYGKIKEGVIGFGSGLLSLIEKPANFILKKLGYKFKFDFEKALRGGWNIVEDDITNLYNKISKSIKSFKTNFTNYFKKISDDLIDFLENCFKKLFKDFFEKIEYLFKDLNKKLLKIGSRIGVYLPKIGETAEGAMERIRQNIEFSKKMYEKIAPKITPKKIGFLSSRYESGEKGSFAIGYDKAGGASYGAYQIATQTGTMDKFLRFIKNKNPEVYNQLMSKKESMYDPSGDFARTWKSLAAEGKIQPLEHEFIRETHFKPEFMKLTEDLQQKILKSKTLQNVLWSRAVHTGKFASKDFEKAYEMQKKSSKDFDEKQFIKDVYLLSSRHFDRAKLGESVFASVQKRLKETEPLLALKMLESEKADSKQKSLGSVVSGKIKPTELIADTEKKILESQRRKEEEAREVTKDMVWSIKKMSETKKSEAVTSDKTGKIEKLKEVSALKTSVDIPVLDDFASLVMNYYSVGIA